MPPDLGRGLANSSGTGVCPSSHFRFNYAFEEGWSFFSFLWTLSGIITLPTQAMHYKREIPKKFHTFLLFDPPKMGCQKIMIRLFVGKMRAQEDKRLREFAKLAFQLFRGFPELGVSGKDLGNPNGGMSHTPLKKSKCDYMCVFYFFIFCIFVICVILIIVLVWLYFINTFSVLYLLMLGLTSRDPRLFSGNR